jgi:hypothetical protein
LSILGLEILFCLLLEKLVNEKYFSVKKKLVWFLRKCFSFILDRKHCLEVVKKLEMSLFANYINFDLQTFNYYIFCFDFFLFYLLEFNLI